MGLFLKKNHLLRCWGNHSILIWIGSIASNIASIPKIASKEIKALILSMKFFSLEIALYFYECNIRPFMEYCGHVWAGAPNCYLDMLDKPHKPVYRNVSHSLAAFLEPLAHHRNA